MKNILNFAVNGRAMTRRQTVPSPLFSVRRLQGSDQEQQQRSGVITFWAIVSLPIFLCVLCIVLEVGNLWLARIQLKNALEAGALAAVKNWGDAGGGDTNISRQVGNQFTSVSLINGAVVDLTTIDGTLNYDAMNGTNQNGSCSGVFVFGAITDDSPEYLFDSCSAAGCGGPGDVMVDASASSNLANSDNNDWGVSIQPTMQSQPGTYVTRVVIRLPATYAGGNPVFDFQAMGNFPTVSLNTADNLVGNKVQCTSDLINCPPDDGQSQADVYGIDRGDVSFFILNSAQFGDDGMGGRLECSAAGIAANGQTGKVLLIEFCDPMSCASGPFEVEDRIRFSALVNDGPGGSPYGGDEIGDMATQVTACFNTGEFVTGTMSDTTDTLTGQQPRCSRVGFAPWGQCNSPGRHGMILNAVGPGTTLRPDQPAPPTNAANNNGQSLITLANVNGGFGFAVRAQTSYDVPSICKNVFGLPVGPFCVTATVDALYDCTLRQPRIYHLDQVNLTCVTPCP